MKAKWLKRFIPAYLLAAVVIGNMSLPSLIKEAKAASNSDDFVIALVPDAQNEVEFQPAIWEEEMQWIADHIADNNIKVVIGTGDNTNYNYGVRPLDIIQYAESKAGWDKITGLGIPYIITIGNHDYDNVTKRTSTTFNKYFGTAYYAGKPWYGGSYNNKAENSYFKFTIGSYNYMVLSLELFPRVETIVWAQSIINANPRYQVIVVTHAYLLSDGTLSQQNSVYGPIQSGVTGYAGQKLWDNFIKINPSIIAVLGGHFNQDWSAYNIGINNDGKKVAQLVVDFQEWNFGGEGYLALLKFSPIGEKIYVNCYSPHTYSYFPGENYIMDYQVYSDFQDNYWYRWDYPESLLYWTLDEIQWRIMSKET